MKKKMLTKKPKQVAEVKKAETPTETRGVDGGELKGVMQETIARVYTEMWSNTKTHNPDTGNIDIEIGEEAYILMLTMVLGNDQDSPRKGLKMRVGNVSTARYCAEHIG